jgi:hypothetical protein
MASFIWCALAIINGFVAKNLFCGCWKLHFIYAAAFAFCAIMDNF